MKPSNNITTPSSHRPPTRNLSIFGILSILLGILSITSPLFIGIAIQYFVGGTLTILGIFQIICAFQGQQFRPFSFFLGLFTLGCGGYLLANPFFGISVITFLLIAYFILSGAIKVITALKLRPLSGWGWEFVSGGISLLLGVALSTGWPVSGAWALGVFLGVNLIITGIFTLLAQFISGKNSPAPSTVIDV